jgi:hypothetical protein
VAAYHPRKLSARGSRFGKKLNSDEHFDRFFSFVAVEGTYQTKKKEITSTTIRTKKYGNSKYNKFNSPLAFAARSASDRTGAGHHRRVDSRASQRNARVRA